MSGSVAEYCTMLQLPTALRSCVHWVRSPESRVLTLLLCDVLFTWTRGHQSVTEGGGAPLLPRLLQQRHAGLGGELAARAPPPAEILSCGEI